MEYYAGIETGGTKTICMIGNSPQDIAAEIRFPTSGPQETIQNIKNFFMEHSKRYTLKGIGIGSFGPIDLDPYSPTYGYITTTLKPGWKNTNLVGLLKEALDIPIAFDTDVNAAAYGEYLWGAAQGLDPMIYITVGTGINCGIVSNNRLYHGLIHPEMGHILIPHDKEKDPFPGNCIFHKDCLEGLASGSSLKERWGMPAELYLIDHPAWELEAAYLARAVTNLILILSPKRIVIGGGVMQHKHLFSLLHQLIPPLLNGYLYCTEIKDTIHQYIVPPALGYRSGVLGAIGMARNLCA
jgi:fructokinase